MRRKIMFLRWDAIRVVVKYGWDAIRVVIKYLWDAIHVEKGFRDAIHVQRRDYYGLNPWAEMQLIGISTPILAPTYVVYTEDLIR